MFQKVIFISLIIGLSFFLYLLKTGDINSSEFNLSILRSPVHFEINKNSSLDDLGNTQSEIKLFARGTGYTIYTYNDTTFDHIPKSEYYKYKIPLEAPDAVTGTWLGSRYIFYVKEYIADKNTEYHVFKAEYNIDSTDEIVYRQIKVIQNMKIYSTDSLY